ncbi:MAG: FAD-dependent oxidoreductase [Rhodomicrobium sp.]
MTKLSVLVAGAGIFGLWQAFELARRGHAVTLREAMPERETGAASRFAGAMLAPDCEAEGAEPIVRELGIAGLKMWREAYPEVVAAGTLVVAAARDGTELSHFARLTAGHKPADASRIAELEPELAGRFAQGLYFPNEAHLAPRRALDFLVSELRRLGAALEFESPVPAPLWLAASAGEAVIDCRGLAAQDQLPELRGVRGEMAVLSAPQVRLVRPIRLLHPRFRLYAVPWGGGVYMIGATSIESQDGGPVRVRSALDLLGTAYALVPAFAEARLLELSAGVRPAFPDNIPKIHVRGRTIAVNGAYRHGYMMAPAIAALVADYLETGRADSPLFDLR